MKLWSIEVACREFSNTIDVPNGSLVLPKPNGFTGDKDRFGHTAEVIGREIRRVEPRSIPDEDGYTHEELYRVRFDDGVEMEMWPEEIILISQTKPTGS